MYFNICKVSYQEEKLIKKIYEALIFLRQDYPNFSSWYKSKVKPGLKTGSRQIYIATPDFKSIAAVMILKNEPEEKKISTLCVMKNYRSQGIGTALINLAIKVFGSSKPIITVSDRHKKEFEPLFAKFNFEHFKEYDGYYIEGLVEHSYNGYLNLQNSENACEVAG